MMNRTKEELLKNHVSEERIKELVVHHQRIVPAILEEVDRGGYAAVAVGRGGGHRKGLIERWLIGSISMKMLEVLEKAALWVSK